MGHSSGEIEGVATKDYVDQNFMTGSDILYKNYVFEFGNPTGNWMRLDRNYNFCALTETYKASCKVEYIGGWWQIYMLGNTGSRCSAVCIRFLK